MAELSVGLKGINQTFTTENLNTLGESITMRLVEGPFSSFRAAWKFRRDHRRREVAQRAALEDGDLPRQLCV